MRPKYVYLPVCLLLVTVLVGVSATAGDLQYNVSASIQATARVVPPVGIEPAEDEGVEGLFWVHSPRPGGVYVTLEDADGAAVGLPADTDLSVLEQHRYRALIAPSGEQPMPESGPVTLTVIYCGN
jgi:hypothetical protein